MNIDAEGNRGRIVREKNPNSHVATKRIALAKNVKNMDF